jgi:hypothetical protein
MHACWSAITPTFYILNAFVSAYFIIVIAEKRVARSGNSAWIFGEKLNINIWAKYIYFKQQPYLSDSGIATYSISSVE